VHNKTGNSVSTSKFHFDKRSPYHFSFAAFCKYNSSNVGYFSVRSVLSVEFLSINSSLWCSLSENLSKLICWYWKTL